MSSIPRSESQIGPRGKHSNSHEHRGPQWTHEIKKALWHVSVCLRRNGATQNCTKVPPCNINASRVVRVPRINADERRARRGKAACDFQLAAGCARETDRGLWNRTLCQRCRRWGIPETTSGQEIWTKTRLSCSAGCFIRRFWCTSLPCGGPGRCVGDAATRDTLWNRGDVVATVALIKTRKAVKWNNGSEIGSNRSPPVTRKSGKPCVSSPRFYIPTAS